MTIEVFNQQLKQARGPFRLLVHRPAKKRKEGETNLREVSEWLKGQTDKDDVEAEALAILGDPRDTVNDVYVWSTRDEVFVCWFLKKDLPTKQAA